MVTALSALPHRTASDIKSPLSHANASLVSATAGRALVTFHVTGSNEDQAVVPGDCTRWPRSRPATLACSSRRPATPAPTGWRTSSSADDFRQAEETSLPITLILLVCVFGALIAAGIPLLLAATAVVTAISLLGHPGQWLPAGQSTSEVVLLIGMAVGIDYSLFYLRREREERAKGREHRARRCGSRRAPRAGPS